LVSATIYETMQIHAFYGEIVDINFHGDGTDFWVANGDEKLGDGGVREEGISAVI
jgi:hypothetical protein